MSLNQSNTLKFHTDLLEYLTKRSRIMSAHKLHTYNDFALQHDFNYSDLSVEELRDEFFQTILPKVFTYNLTDVQRRKIEIYTSHHGFVRTENGFDKQPARVDLPTEGIHFATSLEDAQKHRLSCIIVEECSANPYPDQKIKAWTSAVSSTDDELALSRLLPDAEIQSRLIRAHENFKSTETFPPNLDPNIANKIIAHQNAFHQLSACFAPNKNNEFR